MPAELSTQRLVMRPLRTEHAAAMWPALSDPAIYTWISRDPPSTQSDIEDRFWRIAQPIIDGRDEQWLNWTVWTRDDGQAIGIVEATVSPANVVQIAYMFAPRIWRRGYASEAVSAAMQAMSERGATAFEAVIDLRNHASLALVRRLGFSCVTTRAAQDGAEVAESLWRRAPG